MSTASGCKVERDGAVLWITIDRPQALNALDPATHAALADAFDLYAADPELRVAILTGAGERGFEFHPAFQELQVAEEASDGFVTVVAFFAQSLVQTPLEFRRDPGD